MVLTIFPVPKYKTGLISVQAVMATLCMCSSPQHLLSSASEAAEILSFPLFPETFSTSLWLI